MIDIGIKIVGTNEKVCLQFW